MAARPIVAVWLAFALATHGSVPARAASFSVSPMRVSLSAGKPVAALEVHNESDEPSVVQLELVSWSQNDTDDVYVETAEVLATPPILTVPPGGSRVVRIGLRRPADHDRELTYRLYLQEVPAALPEDFQGMRMTLRVGVPVFVAETTKPKSKLQWRSVVLPDGAVQLTLTNAGNEHVKITELELRAVDGAASGSQQVSTYVLPGQSRQWQIKMTNPVAAGSRLQVTAHSDGVGDVSANLTLEAT